MTVAQIFLVRFDYDLSFLTFIKSIPLRAWTFFQTNAAMASMMNLRIVDASFPSFFLPVGKTVWI